AISLPTSTVHRGSARDHRYVVVRSSISSPIDDATNSGGTTASTSSSMRHAHVPTAWTCGSLRIATMNTIGSAAIASAIHTARPRDRAPLVALDADPVRMLIDQLADLVDVALGEHLAAIDHDDLRRQRLDLVEHVARHHDRLLIRAGLAKFSDPLDDVGARDR